MDCNEVRGYLEKSGKKIPKELGGAIRKHLKGCSSCMELYKKNYKSQSSSKEADSSILNTKFPGYKIIKKIGSGSMGKVYQAYQISMKRYVALKVLSEELSENTKFVKRFIKEARALGEMGHPNVIPVYDMGFSQGMFYYIMEFVEGESLKEILTREGMMEPRDALDIIIQMSRALLHAEKHEVVHRDIKPGNILLSKTKTCKLADLGLAKKRWKNETGDGKDETMVGTIIGTPHYMAPEQIKNSRDVTIQADIYSLGVTFYQLLTGETPFSGKTNFDILSQILHDHATFVDGRDDHVPKAYKRVILRMMARDVEERYSSPQELLENLDKLKKIDPNSSGIRALTGNLNSEFFFRLPKEHIALWAAGIGVMATVILFLAGFIIAQLFSSDPLPTPKDKDKVATTDKGKSGKTNGNGNDSGNRDRGKRDKGKVIPRLTQLKNTYIEDIIAGKKEGKRVYLDEVLVVNRHYTYRKNILILALYDYTGEIKIPLFSNQRQKYEYLENIQVGDFVRVFGEVQFFRKISQWEIKIKEPPPNAHLARPIEIVTHKVKKDRHALGFKYTSISEMKRIDKISSHQHFYFQLKGTLHNLVTFKFPHGTRYRGKPLPGQAMKGEIRDEDNQVQFIILPDNFRTFKRSERKNGLLAENSQVVLLGRWEEFEERQGKKKDVFFVREVRYR